VDCQFSYRQNANAEHEYQGVGNAEHAGALQRGEHRAACREHGGDGDGVAELQSGRTLPNGMWRGVRSVNVGGAEQHMRAVQALLAFAVGAIGYALINWLDGGSFSSQLLSYLGTITSNAKLGPGMLCQWELPLPQ
jgi:hypothetical protein